MRQKDWKNVSVWGLRRWGKPKILKIKEDFSTGGETTEREQNVLLPAEVQTTLLFEIQDDKRVSEPVYIRQLTEHTNVMDRICLILDGGDSRRDEPAGVRWLCMTALSSF